MVRTKDLLLVVLVLVMLGIAISATIAARLFDQQEAIVDLSNSSQSPSPYVAVAPATDEDKRRANIERLRNAIAAGDVIESSPSVEVEAPVVRDEDDALTLTCGTPNTGIDIARSWPLSDVVLRSAGGNRLVVYASAPSQTPATAAATGTVVTPPIQSEVTLLVLPLVAQKLAEPTCLDSEIVGVTSDGSLIFNTDAVLYRSTSPETLIGYARDGFPIYGAYAGQRDQCGGYDSATGYRYTASASSNSLLSCFTGQPRSFSR